MSNTLPASPGLTAGRGLKPMGLDRFRNLIQARGWTQAQAAERFGVSQARVSALVRGKWQKFSLDMRVTLAARAGQRVELAA